MAFNPIQFLNSNRYASSLVRDHWTHGRWRQAAILWPTCFVCGAEPWHYHDYTDGTLKCGGCGVVLLTPEVGHRRPRT